MTYDANGNLLDSNGNVYQYTPSYVNNTDTIIKPSGSGTIGGIGTIGTKGGGGGGSGGGSGGGGAGAVTGLGALAAGLLGSKTGGAPDFGLQSIGQGNFSWNANAVNAPENGVAYGQQILNPTYTPSAKEGGMVKHLASGGQAIIGAKSNFTQLPTIGPNGLLPASYGVSPYTSTVAQNGINVAPAPNAFKQGGAVHREIYNALKQAGHPIDGDTISKIAHLNEIGAPAHHIVGFLNHQRMSSGGPLGAYSDGGHFLKGPGDGMSDDIPARIGEHQEARLANEEFVIPADVVSHLGNGSSEAGAKVLYKMMDKIRHARTGTTKQGKQINPDKFMPT